MATHPDKCGITTMGIVFANPPLVVGSTNPITIDDGGLLVHTKPVGEVFPELLLMLAVSSLRMEYVNYPLEYTWLYRPPCPSTPPVDPPIPTEKRLLM
jgi:hypothetical protein